MRWRTRDASGARDPERDRDRHWRRETRTAVLGAAAVLTTFLVIDWGDGSLRPWRAVLWCALSLLLLVILLPARVTAGEDWLRSRGLLRECRVRLDQLDAVRWSGDIAPRLVLTDTHGGRVELDPRVLSGNPLLWHRIESAARRRAALLTRGADVLREIADRVDGEALRALDPEAETVMRSPDPRTAPRSAARTRSRGARRQRR